MLLSLFAILWFQTAPSLDTPGVVLILSGDTVFVTPTNSIGRAGDIRTATFIEIFPLGPEGWEEVRRDNDVEIDCKEGRIRSFGGRASDAEGRIRSTYAAESREWEPIGEDYPPLAVLRAVTCSDIDLAAVSFESLEAELPRLRARLQ